MVFFSFAGKFIYLFLGYPIVDIGTDKPIYVAGCDTLAVIQTTAVAYATPTKECPLNINITSPAGEEEQIKYSKLESGTYISYYNLKDKPEGRYKLKATVKNQGTYSSVKFFLLVNETNCNNAPI